jgi:GcrA cell cycle regulator
MTERTDQAIVEQIRAMRLEGKTYRNIAEVIGKSRDTVKSLAGKYQLRYLGPELFWTPERLERARQMLAEGYSASQVATELGCTRNAVIGKARRSLVEFKNKPGFPLGNQLRMHPAPSQAQPEPKPTPIPEEKPPRLPTSEPVELDGEARGPTWVRFADLEPRHCRWPVEGQPGPDMWCCGTPRAEPSSYCAHHRRVARTGA